MRIDTTSGLLDSARQCPSPNCDDRPTGVEPELIVIHNISLPPGQFGGSAIDAFFTNRLDSQAHPYFAEISNLRVSAHALIRRNGEIVQYVPLHRRAWHAGVSSYNGRNQCNDFSIGIELEGTDAMVYTEAQYQQLSCLVGCLLFHYPTLSAERIVGHSDIAPGRKTDPGRSFDWPLFRTQLASVLP